MDGESYYNIAREQVVRFGLEGHWPEWDALGWKQQEHWDQLAAENGLKDRPESASVQRMKGHFRDDPR